MGERISYMPDSQNNQETGVFRVTQDKQGKLLSADFYSKQDSGLLAPEGIAKPAIGQELFEDSPSVPTLLEEAHSENSDSLKPESGFGFKPPKRSWRVALAGMAGLVAAAVPGAPMLMDKVKSAFAESPAQVSDTHRVDLLPSAETQEVISVYKSEFVRQIGNTVVGVISTPDGKKYAMRSTIDVNGDLSFKTSGELNLSSAIVGAAVSEQNPSILVVVGSAGELWYTIDGGQTSKKVIDSSYFYNSVDLTPDGTQAYVSRGNNSGVTSFGEFDIATNSITGLSNSFRAAASENGTVVTKTPLKQSSNSLYNFGTIQYGTGIVRTDFFPDNSFSLLRFGRDIPVDFFVGNIHSYIDKNGKNIVWGFEPNAVNSTGKGVGKMYVFTDNINTSVVTPKESLFPSIGAIQLSAGVSNLAENKGYWGVNFYGQTTTSPYVDEFQLDDPNNQVLLTRNGLPDSSTINRVLPLPINGDQRLALDIHKSTIEGKQGIWLLNKTKDAWEFQSIVKSPNKVNSVFLPAVNTQRVQP